MKTLILTVAALLATGMATKAQTAIEQSKLSDNISLTLKGGAATPLNSSDFWGNMRGVFGLELRKQITPTFGLGIEGQLSINTAQWYGIKNANTFEHQLLGTYGAINLMNLFGGYNGTPRAFEIEAIAGVGWLHYYAPIYDANSWYTRTGLNLNYNFGNDRQWTLALMPSVVWNMNGDMKHAAPLGQSSQFSSNQAALQILAGITYHFGNSNGTHSFALVQPYDYDEMLALNSQINDLRSDLEASMVLNAAMEMENVELAQKLEECLNREPKVVTDSTNTLNTVRYVFFKQGSSIVTSDQAPNVEQIATYLKKHKNASVIIKGYASPEGNLDFNIKLAAARAESVKNMLINKYGISSNRITAEGQGIGEMFTEPTWNRVSICTIKENETK